MIVVAASCPDALMRSNNSSPASAEDPRVETWSVSRISNLFFVGLLLPILASEPLGFSRDLVVGHAADGAAPILHDGSQLEDLYAQIRDLFLEAFHTIFKCLRHAENIGQRHREFHHENSARGPFGTHHRNCGPRAPTSSTVGSRRHLGRSRAITRHDLDVFVKGC